MKTYLLLLALLVVPTFTPASAAKKSSRPNILYFYVDDMGWGSIGPNGQAKRKAKNLPYVRTPNLDRLASQGINFRRGYGCHVCSPARSSQQSGFHQGHTFADRNDPNNAKKAMRADDILMGDALAAAGYTTGYWGKWGYGGSKTQVNPVIENIQTVPTSHGYQFVLAELHHVRAHTFYQPTLWSAPTRRQAPGGLELIPNSMARYQNNKDYPNAPAFQNHSKYPKTAYCDDTYAFAALDFVRAQAQNYKKSGQPFFGLLAVQIPHAPFDEISSLPDWSTAYSNDRHFKRLAAQSKQWAAMVTRIDAHFGNILAALEDPNNDGDESDSVADNTLVIFQSDNGGPGGKNNVELNANGGLRGTKGSIYEGGIRVPLVMRWPAKINNASSLKVGTDTNRVVDVTDLLPTFCELAGAPIPLGIDGVSIAPTLLGSGHQRHRDFIIHEAGNGQSIIHGKHKLIRSKKSLQLFDLEADHAEANNIAAKNPKLVKTLETLLLGERVAEPRGFANTYHHWIGKDGEATSLARNWSDYTYANAGITYMTDKGTPRLSWVARIENTGTNSNTARAGANLEFLGLEIRGNAKTKASQSLVLGKGINLTGRNEIRLSAHATLTVNGGTVSSLRWLDIHPDATLNGHGTIDATIYNSGTINAGNSDQSALNVSSDYHQTKKASLKLSLNGKQHPSILIEGNADIAGTLSISNAKGFKPAPGKPYTILKAKNVTGTFANASDTVVTPDGVRFAIHYSNTAVTLITK